MLKIGDKIKYVKENVFMEFPLGTIFEITDIRATTLAVVGEYKVNGVTTGKIQGIMSYNEYEKHFEKYVEKEADKRSQYTNWKTIAICNGDCRGCYSYCLCGYLEGVDIWYKHNNKRVVAKVCVPDLFPNMLDGKVITVCASCHPEDVFDLNVGLDACINKLNKKVAQQIIKNANENLKKY